MDGLVTRTSTGTAASGSPFWIGDSMAGSETSGAGDGTGDGGIGSVARLLATGEGRGAGGGSSRGATFGETSLARFELAPARRGSVGGSRCGSTAGSPCGRRATTDVAGGSRSIAAEAGVRVVGGSMTRGGRTARGCARSGGGDVRKTGERRSTKEPARN